MVLLSSWFGTTWFALCVHVQHLTKYCFTFQAKDQLLREIVLSNIVEYYKPDEFAFQTS